MLDSRFYFALFLRRLPYFLIFTVAGAAMGVALALTLPPSFQAQARLVVESEQIPGELASTTVLIEAREQLQIIQQRILTRDTLLEMANRLNIYAEQTARDGERLPADQIVDDLRARVKIETTGGGGNRRNNANATFVDVSFTAGSPTLAAQVTNEVVTLMLEENVAMRTGASGQTLDFFEQEVSRLDEELSRRGAQIIQFQEANKDSLPESLNFRRTQLSAAQERLLQLSREEAALEDRRKGLVALYEATGSIGANAGGNVPLTPAESRLRELQERLTATGAVLAFDNPRIRVLRAQIEALEAQVAQEGLTAVETGNGEEQVSVNLSLYDIQLADLDNQLAFLTAQRSEIEAEMEVLQSTLEATPANAIALDTLQRDYDATRIQYDQAVANRGRAETGDIIEALKQGQRISILDQAVPPEEPTSPNRPKLAIAGLGGGMMLGLGFILLLELLNTAIRRPQDIVQQLEITPLGTLPFIRTRGDQIRRRITLLVILASVVVFIFGTLWAINTYVTPLDLLFRAVLERLPQLNLSFPSQDG